MDTFLVQVWVPADDRPPDAELRGLVRHVATGTETPFHGDQEVIDFLRRATHRRTTLQGKTEDGG
ncbi:MAG TPA: hypothetical protein VHF91_00230 [Acidimicrobiales bacterium]|nr:hypothetical protein [Acidimicrobiales bacterium]